MPRAALEGGVVATVEPGAARDAGVLAGDRVVAVDGAPAPWRLFPILAFWLLALFHRVFKR